MKISALWYSIGFFKFLIVFAPIVAGVICYVAGQRIQTIEGNNRANEISSLQSELKLNRDYIIENTAPEIKVTLNDTFKGFNLFSFTIQNIGVNDVEITGLHQNYYINSMYMVGQGETPPRTTVGSILIETNKQEEFRINFSDNHRDLEKRKENIAKKDKVEKAYHFILNIQILYKHKTSEKEHIKNLFYVIVPDRIENGFMKFRIWDALKSQIQITDAHNYIREIKEMVNDKLNE